MEAYREFCELLESVFDFLTMPLDAIVTKRSILQKDEAARLKAAFVTKGLISYKKSLKNCLRSAQKLTLKR